MNFTRPLWVGLYGAIFFLGGGAGAVLYLSYGIDIWP